MANASRFTAAVLSILAVIAPTVHAQSGATSPSPPAISQSSIDRSVAQSLLTTQPTRFSTLALRPAVRAQQNPSDPASEPGKFFTSPRGIAVLAVLGAGIGYGIYSKIHDRIHSKNPDR